MFLWACIDFALVVPPAEGVNTGRMRSDDCHLFVRQVELPAEVEMGPFETSKSHQRRP